MVYARTLLKFRSLIGFPLVRIQHSPLNIGGVTEWFKVPDLNSGDSVINPDRGFESYRLFYASMM